MLFHEVYGCYFAAAAKIIRLALAGGLRDADIEELVRKEAFAESVLSLPRALRETWPLLTPELGTPLRQVPDLPLTTLEKRWLKALMMDPRHRLFGLNLDGLEAVEPLFGPEMFDYFDRYQDGDPYDDAGYAQRFRAILAAIEGKKKLRVRYAGSRGTRGWDLSPQRLVYSSRDDKFRLLAASEGRQMTLNLARMESCEPLEEPSDVWPQKAAGKKRLTLEIVNERNALERAMLHFSHFEKETRREGDKYRMSLRYDRDDEADMLIRVLSFGPMIRVISPEGFITQLRRRLRKQASLSKAR